VVGDDGADPLAESCTLHGLKAGTTYHWKVVEVRADGTRLESAVRTFVTGS